jgi:hypothetical protein
MQNESPDSCSKMTVERKSSRNESFPLPDAGTRLFSVRGGGGCGNKPNPRKPKIYAFLAGTLALWIGSSPALSATRSSSFAVSAIVEAGCQVSEDRAALNGSTPHQANPKMGVSVVCSLPVPYRVMVEGSSGGGAAAQESPTPYRMHVPGVLSAPLQPEITLVTIIY